MGKSPETLHYTCCTIDIATSESEFEAQQYLHAIENKFQLVVQQNEAILRRFEQYNLHLEAEDASIRFLCDDVSTIRDRRNTLHENHGSGPPSPGQIVSEDSTLAQAAAFNAHSSQDFESALKMTRVYRRVRASECDISFRSSAVRSHAWSVLSDLSIGDISVISVLALPISLEEINNIAPHLTFASILSYPGTYDTREADETVALGTATGPPADQTTQSSAFQTPEVAQDEVASRTVPRATADDELSSSSTFTSESASEPPLEASTPVQDAVPEEETSAKQSNR